MPLLPDEKFERAPHRCKRCGQPCSPTDICGDCMEKQIKQEASAPAAPPDTRTIQEVLELHVASCQSMYETYERTGDAEGCRYEKGKIDGLKRAIEVADSRAARQTAAIDAELRELRARRKEANMWNEIHVVVEPPCKKFGDWASRRLDDLDEAIAAREKELEGRK